PSARRHGRFIRAKHHHGLLSDPRWALVLSPLQFSQSSRGGTQRARDREAVARAVATWNAADLEEATAPAAWRERRQNGRDTRKALRWRRCHSWRSCASATAPPNRFQPAIGRSRASAFST